MKLKLFFSIPFYFICCLILSVQFCSCNAQNNTTLKPEQTNIDTMINNNENEWKEKLSPEQYYILREKGTEKPFSGKFYLHKEKGTYTCAGCGNELFTSNMKFESHCGWPSFDKEIAGGKIIQKQDNSHGMSRTEILCANCGGHLGHIFNDGPTETGQRYCVNSLSLAFEPAEESTLENDTITLGGGCFWCIEAVFNDLKGVVSATSGYSGGKSKNVSYKDVCSGTTGHTEVVQVIYNPKEVSLAQILEVFFTIHDPTTLNRQGNDVGTQYRSAIYYHKPEQATLAQDIIKELNQNKAFEDPIVTEVTAFDFFVAAENYHQEYFERNGSEPYCQMVVKPKVDKFKKIFKEYLKK